MQRLSEFKYENETIGDMASLEWQVQTQGEITLVEAQVTSAYETQVRLESALSPVWAPRTQGVPVEGWDKTGYETTVGRNETVAVGFASPAEPVEPPLELIEQEATEGAPGDSESQPSSRDLLRTLGDSRPPRDITPKRESATQQQTEPVERQPESTQPPALQSWFDAIENRIEVAERLATPSDATEARAVIAEHGGIERIQRLDAQLAADEKQLSALKKRQTALLDRLATTDIPVRTLERLE